MTVENMTAKINYAEKVLHFLNDMKKHNKTDAETIKKLRSLLTNDITWYEEAIDQELDAMYENSREVRANVKL